MVFLQDMKHDQESTKHRRKWTKRRNLPLITDQERAHTTNKKDVDHPETKEKVAGAWNPQQHSQRRSSLESEREVTMVQDRKPYFLRYLFYLSEASHF